MGFREAAAKMPRITPNFKETVLIVLDSAETLPPACRVTEQPAGSTARRARRALAVGQCVIEGAGYPSEPRDDDPEPPAGRERRQRRRGGAAFGDDAATLVEPAEHLGSSSTEWEKLSIFLNFLTPKLPAPEEQDLSRGILGSIEMDSYRVEAQATMSIALSDADADIGPVPLGGGGRKPESELDLLSNILKTFNEMFGNIDWKDADKIGKVIAEELPIKVAADKAYQNAMKNSDRQNARIEHDKALERAVIELLTDHTELFKQFSDNPSFKKWLADTTFAVTYDTPESTAQLD